MDIFPEVLNDWPIGTIKQRQSGIQDAMFAAGVSQGMLSKVGARESLAGPMLLFYSQ
ncbi:MAG: hypothetical protein ACNYPE_09035 [Candidatus Azotimanducaceae bacterium WSBS_2022_MAG_OTU7]